MSAVSHPGIPLDAFAHCASAARRCLTAWRRSGFIVVALIAALVALASPSPLWAEEAPVAQTPATQTPATQTPAATSGQGSSQGQEGSRHEDLSDPEDENGQDDDIAAEQEEDEAMAQHLDGAGEGAVDSGNILQGLESEYMEDEEAAGSEAPAAEK